MPARDYPHLHQEMVALAPLLLSVVSEQGPDPGLVGGYLQCVGSGSGFFPRSGSRFETRFWIRSDPDIFKDPDSDKKCA